MSPEELEQLVTDAAAADWRTRALAVTRLSSLRSPETQRVVEQALGDDNLAVVDAAVATLLEWQSPTRLIECMKTDDEIGVRVADLVGEAQPGWLIDELIGRLDSGRLASERVDAADLLGFVLEATAALPALQAARQDSDAHVAAAARDASNHLLGLLAK